jgi:hypothetical protein
MLLSERNAERLRIMVDRMTTRFPILDAIDRLLKDSLVQRDLQDTTGSVILKECVRRMPEDGRSDHDLAVAAVYAGLWSHGVAWSLGQTHNDSR